MISQKSLNHKAIKLEIDHFHFANNLFANAESTQCHKIYVMYFIINMSSESIPYIY